MNTKRNLKSNFVPVKPMRKMYINISLPHELVREINFAVSNNSFGYKNRAELTKEALRNHLRELNNIKEITLKNKKK